MKITATKTFFIISALILISAAAFGQRRNELAGTEWKLTTVNGRVLTNTLAAIEFDANGAKFTGNTGCNQMSGNVWIRSRQIHLTGIGTTKRACRLIAGSVAEEVFVRSLRQASRYRLQGRTLRFTDRRGRTVLQFQRSRGDGDSGEAARLDNRKWVLEQIKGRQTFAPLPYAYVNFDANRGGAGGDSGCNAFGGSYRATGTSIAIFEVIATMRACIEDDAKMATERDMLDGLRRANWFEIRDGRLHLYHDRELLLSFRGERK